MKKRIKIKYEFASSSMFYTNIKCRRPYISTSKKSRTNNVELQSFEKGVAKPFNKRNKHVVTL